jgi:hypothetical protein
MPWFIIILYAAALAAFVRAFILSRREYLSADRYYREAKRGRVSLAPQWPADSGGGE